MVSAQGIQSAKQTYMRNSNTTCGIPSKLLRHDANASLMRKSTSPSFQASPGKSRVQVRLVRRPVEQAQSRRLAPVLRIIGGQNFIMHDEMCDRFVFQGHSHMFLVSVMNDSVPCRHGTIQATQLRRLPSRDRSLVVMKRQR
ncbi:hypothetical protein NEUTE2DRAFT_122774 [Neurospora tetrasperma FGSC 2509]|nr:hypothetical protein NEUTE2DRAFT_122774 [Neurospora tetrasperma FGSC 2509]